MEQPERVGKGVDMALNGGRVPPAFLKSEMKKEKADVIYAELVKRLKKHGLKERGPG